MQDRHFPVPCPEPMCSESIANEDVQQLLQGAPDLQVSDCNLQAQSHGMI
jgi:hypothetical protein